MRKVRAIYGYNYNNYYTLNDIAHACVFVYTALPFSLFATFSLVLRQKRRKCMSSVIVVISCGEQPRTTKMEEQKHGTCAYTKSK